MSPQVGKAGFRLAFYIVFVSVLMLLFLRPGTAGFAVTVLTLVIGLLFIAVVVAMLRFFSR